jgi:short-subunit dehydrogenase
MLDGSPSENESDKNMKTALVTGANRGIGLKQHGSLPNRA